MLKLYVRAMDIIRNAHRQEEAQDGFEYLLVSGAVVVAIVVAIVAGINNDSIGAIVTAVETKVTNTIGA